MIEVTKGKGKECVAAATCFLNLNRQWGDNSSDPQNWSGGDGHQETSSEVVQVTP